MIIENKEESEVEIEEETNLIKENNNILYILKIGIGLEIILYIFSFLNYKDLNRISKVCKLFKELAFHPSLPQWKYLNLFPFRKKITEKNLLIILQRCHYLKKLNISYCKLLKNIQCIEKFIQNGYFHYLEEIDLSGTVFTEVDMVELAEKLLSNCPHLILINFSWTKLKLAENIQNILIREGKRLV